MNDAQSNTHVKEIGLWVATLMGKGMVPQNAYQATANRYGVTPEYVAECFKGLTNP